MCPNILFSFQGGPSLEQRFESYYNYCNLFNYILSKSQIWPKECI
jgi:translation initiation factor 3 subunit L